MGVHALPATGPHRTSIRRFWLTVLAGLAAVVATVALTYLTIELPRWLAGLVEEWVEIPGYYRAIEPEDLQQYNEIGSRSWAAVSRFIEANHLYAIAWVCLALASAAIVGGLVLRRGALAALGAIALFMPVIGSYAGSMVFLLGIGILRVVWLPAWGTGIMALGDVAYLPYMAVVWPAWQVGLDVRFALAYLAVGAGLLVFVVATAQWFNGHLSGTPLQTGGIYRYSRHPQYLGWIAWSWGMTLHSALQPMPYGGFNPGGALAWTVATIVIVAVAWLEEARMVERKVPGYAAYRARTPFLLPLPRLVRRLAAAPLRVVSPDGLPRRGTRILLAAALYLGLAMVLSLPFAVLDWPPLDWWAWPGYTWNI
jgi:protein-S-isoprenylcysteine O-methyltransferase Ste14